MKSDFSPSPYMGSEPFEAYYYNHLNFSETTLHTHDFYEFYLFVKSNISISINGLPQAISSGDIVFIPPGISHRLIENSLPVACQRFVFRISTAYYEQLRSLSPCYFYIMEQAPLKKTYCFHCDRIVFNTLQHKILQFIKEKESDRFGRIPKIMLCANDFLLQVNREYYKINHQIAESTDNSISEALLQLIEENISQDISLDYLSSRLYMSKYHICHVFKEHFGISIHQYIIKRRLELCRDAFLCGTPLSKIYDKYGFKDYSSFYRAFVKEYGAAPKEYKKQHAKKGPQVPRNL